MEGKRGKTSRERRENGPLVKTFFLQLAPTGEKPTLIPFVPLFVAAAIASGPEGKEPFSRGKEQKAYAEEQLSPVWVSQMRRRRQTWGMTPAEWALRRRRTFFLLLLFLLVPPWLGFLSCFRAAGVRRKRFGEGVLLFSPPGRVTRRPAECVSSSGRRRHVNSGRRKRGKRPVVAVKKPEGERVNMFKLNRIPPAFRFKTSSSWVFVEEEEEREEEKSPGRKQKLKMNMRGTKKCVESTIYGVTPSMKPR
jgi:hypothetical protein